MKRYVPAVLIALSIAFAPRGALASIVFDDYIRMQYGYPPDIVVGCTYCHRTTIGGEGTVIHPFGLATIEYGTVKLDVEALKAAFQKMEMEGVDSDCDGTPDIQELKDRTNPNLDANGMFPADCGIEETPRYGCYCRLPVGHATGPAAPAAASAGVLLTLLGARRRWRRREREAR